MRRSVAVLAAALAAAVPANARAATPWIGLQPVSVAVPSYAQSFGPRLVVSSLAVSSSGRALTAWVGTDGTLLASRRPPGGSWSAPEVISPNAKAVGGITIDTAIDDAGDATVLWVSSARELEATTVKADQPGAATVTLTTLPNGVLPDVHVDLAMNAGGAAAAVYDTNSASSGNVGAAASATAGGAWTTPVIVSDPSAGHGAAGSRVAINAAGRAVVTFVDITHPASDYVYSVRGDVASGGAFSASAVAFAGTGGDLPRPAIDAAGRVSVLFRNGAEVWVGTRGAGAQTFTVPEQLTGACSSASLDVGGSLTLSGDGARTVIYPCGGRLRSLVRGPSQSFAGAGAGAQDLGAITDVALATDESPDGHAVVVSGSGASLRAFRRSSDTVPFGAAEALFEPDDANVLPEGVGLDAAGDAIGLVGRTRAQGMSAVVDHLAALLDVTPPAASIAGPATAAPGDLVTFTNTSTDAFGGLAGAPAWTSSDGGSSSSASFTRTFVAAGSYQIELKVKDVSGNTAIATKQITVTAPPPAQGPTTVPATTPPAVPTSTVTTPQTTPSPVIPVASRSATCTVPSLKGKSLTAAKAALKRAGCALGTLKKPTRRRGAPAPKLVVSKQSPAAKRVVARGTKVALTLKAKAARKR